MRGGLKRMQVENEDRIRAGEGKSRNKERNKEPC